MRELEMTIGGVRLRARLRATPTADAVWAALPLQARAQTWGEEVYFTVPGETALSRMPATS